MEQKILDILYKVDWSNSIPSGGTRTLNEDEERQARHDKREMRMWMEELLCQVHAYECWIYEGRTRGCEGQLKGNWHLAIEPDVYSINVGMQCAC